MPRRRILTGIAAVAAIVVLAVWFFAFGPGARLLSPPGSTVVKFSGNGSSQTSSFSVREGWQLEWESAGQTFHMAIRGDRDFGTVIDLTGAGSGTTSPVGGGTFHLEITGQGPWHVRIIQGD